MKNILFSSGSKMRHSDFWFSINRFRPDIKEKVVRRDTGLCIEGFQRSGNTYFEMMFELSNPDIKISHHIHGVANLKKAIRFNIPAVLLIREPQDALASLLTYDPILSPELALNAYVAYYSRVLDLEPAYVLISFNELIENYNLQIDRVNNQFLTQFELNEYSDLERKKIMKERQSLYKNQLSTPYPSQVKQQMNQKHRVIIQSLSSYSIAYDLYQEVLNQNQSL